ncbi:IclR family transcriptional regulator [Candidatus Enterococcus huntleyi]|uniref:IclR family transcriptional regulator n=1 Tax=Candidatus Enterococcus huntleyi TaxID=1857217 RepID=UPI001F330133|nr:IclR family transcriptional regulator [Enterococcus sp. JM4C]
MENFREFSGSKSLNKTLAILSSFDDQTPIQRTSDIAARLDMNMSTVSRHLNTLLDWGFLDRDEDTGYYYPGVAIVALAGRALQNNDVYRHAFPEVQRLSYRHNVHGHMGVAQKDKIVHLISSCHESSMDLLIPMGYKHPMHCSAMGRVFLAYLSPIEAQQILKSNTLLKYAHHTKVDICDINQELIRTRQQGYCLLVNELAEGIGSIAAPVFNRNREVVAAISVSASARSLADPAREQVLAQAVKAAASRVSSKLGFYPR